MNEDDLVELAKALEDIAREFDPCASRCEYRLVEMKCNACVIREAIAQLEAKGGE